MASLDPNQASPIAGLVMLSSGAGMNGLLLLYGAIQIVWSGGRLGGWFGQFMLVNACGFVVLGVLLVIWVKSWSRIRRLESRSRWLLVVACGLAMLANLIVFTMLIN